MRSARASGWSKKYSSEAEVLDVLGAIALPGGFAGAVGQAVAARLAKNGKGSRQSALRAIDARLRRLQDLYELGDLAREEYLRRRDELQAERKALAEERPRRDVGRLRIELQTPVDRWESMTPGRAQADDRPHLRGDPRRQRRHRGAAAAG